MNDQLKDVDTLFAHLVLSLQGNAVQHMGKIVSQASGDIERNMEAAKATIDMIEMLEKKMKGNLTDDETKLIGHVLYELRLNYVDETKKDDSSKSDKTDDSDAESAEKKPEKTDEKPDSDSSK